MSKLDSKMMDLLGDNTMGIHSLPNDWSSIEIRDGKNAGDSGFRIWFTNDAYELCFSYTDQNRVKLMMGRKSVNKLVFWWIRRVWIAEWFGLRRTLYYFFLKRQVKGFKTDAQPRKDK